MEIRVWLGESEPTLEGYEWVREATILSVYKSIDAIAISGECGSVNGLDFISLMADNGAAVGTLLIYEKSEAMRESMAEAAINAGVAENVLVSDDGGYSFVPAK